MNSILITMLSGLVINIITYLSGKLNLSKTYVSVGLSLFLGVVVYSAQLLINKYPLQREQIVAFITGCYGVSQVIWNIWQKINPENK